LYLWIAEHRSHLEKELGFPIRVEYAVGHIQEENRTGWVSRLASIILPDEFEDGPPVGQWRENLETRAEDRLFLELLVPLNGKEDGWCALEQSFMVARHEHSLLHGLHVTISENDPELEAIREEFNRRCSEKGAAGNLIVTGGEVVEQTCLRATATDLVVVNLSYPPAPQPLARLGSGFRTLLLRCPRPVLATPQTVSPLSHALLAFDGSVKAREALYIAAYLSEKWGIPLEVVSVEDSSRTTQETLSQAKTYLENHNVQARYFLESGHPAEAILRVHQREGCDWIVMGGYGLNPLLEFVLGSTVDQVLRESNVPTLICR
jgi:nucleotide-binding universal stress UspA family protein